jgi:predicted DNA-binding protein
MYYMEEVMTTVRLPLEIEQRLEILSRKKHKSKTEVIKEALDTLFFKEESEKDSYELGAEYFGRFGSGDGSLSVSYKEKIKAKISDKLHSD